MCAPYSHLNPNSHPNHDTSCAGPCYRCLFPACPMPQACSRCCDAGVLGVVPGVIGSLQVCESKCCLLCGVNNSRATRAAAAERKCPKTIRCVPVNIGSRSGCRISYGILLKKYITTNLRSVVPTYQHWLEFQYLQTSTNEF